MLSFCMRNSAFLHPNPSKELILWLFSSWKWVACRVNMMKGVMHTGMCKWAPARFNFASPQIRWMATLLLIEPKYVNFATVLIRIEFKRKAFGHFGALWCVQSFFTSTLRESSDLFCLPQLAPKSYHFWVLSNRVLYPLQGQPLKRPVTFW